MKKFFHKILDLLHINGRDLTVFLLSLLLAFTIWLIHNLTLNYSEIISIPVVAQSNIDGHASESTNSTSIVARCRTSGFRLLNADRFSRKRTQTVRFDKSDFRYRSGENYYLTSSTLERYVQQIFGDDVKLESFISDTVVFRFPYENHKMVPVAVQQVLDFRPQYTAIGDISIEPDSVMIYGEPNHLENVDRVVTQTITLTDLHSGVHGVARIEKIQGIRISEENIRYSLAVSRYVEVKVTLPLSVVNAPEGRQLLVYPSSADVVFRCIFPVSTDPTESVRLYIDYNDFANSINGRCIPKTNRLPQGIIDYRISPEVFDCVEIGK